MPAIILRLLTVLALALMPLGMGMSDAAPAHHAPAAETVQHCGEHGRQPDRKAPNDVAGCTVTCSMLLTAEVRVADPAPAVRLPAARPLAERRTGLHPETATPPPKLS